MLRILEQKGAVKRELEGRAHIYFPAFERDDAAGTAFGDVVRSFFADSKTALAMRLIAEEKPDRDELARMKKIIEAYEEDASMNTADSVFRHRVGQRPLAAGGDRRHCVGSAQSLALQQRDDAPRSLVAGSRCKLHRSAG